MQKGLSVNILMTHHVNKLKEQYHFNGRQKVFVKIWQLFIIKEKKSQYTSIEEAYFAMTENI